MAYLIDTQILIWSLSNPSKLSVSTKNQLENSEIFVSQISLFEIAIKQKIGKLIEIDLNLSQLINQIESDGFEILPIKNTHISAYDQVLLFEHHRDPFDRLLLATSLSENLPIISADENFRFYTPQIQLIEN